MHEDFERYRQELDRVRLTAESKKALAESLGRCQTRGRTIRPLRMRRIIAAAAVVCLLAVLSVAGIAQINAGPTLGTFFSGDQAGYDQSSGVIGRSAENDGWIITVTDCVGDDYMGFLGIEVEAPEGVVLDAEYYEIYADNDYDAKGSHSLKGFFYSLPDDDPTDGKIHMIHDWYARGGEANHQFMRLKLVDLTENRGYLWDEHNWDRPMVKEGEWDFGWIDIDYADNAIRLSPMVELPCEADLTDTGVEKLILEEVVISPVGLYFRTNISLPYPVALEDWLEENMWFTVQLLDTDGNEIPLVNPRFYGLSGTYICFTDTTNAMNTADFEGQARLDLVDLDRVASVSVCGVTIPLK